MDGGSAGSDLQEEVVQYPGELPPSASPLGSIGKSLPGIRTLRMLMAIHGYGQR